MTAPPCGSPPASIFPSLRRVNQAIYLLTTGSREAAFRNVKTIAECLADELINAAKGSSNSTPSRRRMSWSASQGEPIRGLCVSASKL